MKISYASALIAAAGLTLAACGGHGAGENGAAAGHGANQVEIVAQGMRFVQAPDRIPAGWTTIRFRNESTLTHFAIVERLPKGMGVQEYEKAGRVYQRAMNRINAGEQKAGMKERCWRS